MTDITPRERKKGRVYEARWPDPDRPGKFRTRTFKKESDARQHLKDLPKLQAAEKAKARADASPTIGQALRAWLLAAETTGIDDNDPVQDETLRHYRTEAAHFDPTIAAKPIPGAVGLLLLDENGKPDPTKPVASIRLAALTTRICQDIRAALLATMTRKNAQRCFSRLRFALNQAVRQGHIEVNPASGVSIKIGSRHKEPVAIPDEEEVQALLKAALENKNDRKLSISVPWIRYELMLRLLVSSGMRPSELRGMPVSAIDAEFPLISITQKAEEDGTISSVKTKAGRRDIRIPKHVHADLLAWIEDRGLKPDDLLFGTDTGRPQSLANITNHLWYPLQIKAGLTVMVKDKASDSLVADAKYNLYSLRHFYASMQIALGANQKELQEAMGHEDIRTTLDTYGHLFKRRSGGGQAARAEAMADILAGKKPEGEAGKVVEFRRVG